MTSIGAMIRREIAPERMADHAREIAPMLDELWIVEDVPYAGGISQLGHVLSVTSDVVVGHGIAPAPFRNPMALAMEWATLERLHPGRVACGIGHGLQTWMASIGEQVASPLTLLEETIVATKQLLGGHEPTMDGRYRSLSDYKLEFPPHRVPTISAGVVGPKSLVLSGRVADGTILPESTGPENVKKARALIDRGRSEAKRTDDHRITVFAGVFCGDPADLGPPPEGVITDGWDVIETSTAAAAAKLQTLVDAGVDSLVLVPFGPEPQDQLRQLLDNVVPLISLTP